MRDDERLFLIRLLLITRSAFGGVLLWLSPLIVDHMEEIILGIVRVSVTATVTDDQVI